MWTVEKRPTGWYFSKSAYHGDRHNWRGPYGSEFSVTLMIARELRKEIKNATHRKRGLGKAADQRQARVYPCNRIPQTVQSILNSLKQSTTVVRRASGVYSFGRPSVLLTGTHDPGCRSRKTEQRDAKQSRRREHSCAAADFFGSILFSAVAPLEDGRVSVAIGATLCEPVGEHDLELFNLDMASERVETLDQALAIIRDAVISTMLN